MSHNDLLDIAMEPEESPQVDQAPGREIPGIATLPRMTNGAPFSSRNTQQWTERHRLAEGQAAEGAGRVETLSSNDVTPCGLSDVELNHLFDVVDAYLRRLSKWKPYIWEKIIMFVPTEQGEECMTMIRRRRREEWQWMNVQVWNIKTIPGRFKSNLSVFMYKWGCVFVCMCLSFRECIQ